MAASPIWFPYTTALASYTKPMAFLPRANLKFRPPNSFDYRVRYEH